MIQLLDHTKRTDNTFQLSYPIGVKYYDTKVDSPNKELTWVVGSGEFSPAVEEALLGTLTYFLSFHSLEVMYLC